MIPTLLAALALQAAPAPDPCPVDRDAMLALGIHAFDQDMNGGWRVLAQRPGCEGRAADLIRDYRAFVQARTAILYWHEAQLRANLGETEAAIALMERARKPEDAAWNFYVDASIAFLRGDRAALARAREGLAGVPAPEGFREQVLPNGYRVRWPMNLDVVDGLVRCFGRPYRDAYGSNECRRPEGTGGER